MAYLLDTNVISELRKYEKRLAAPGILAWVPTVRPEDLYVSVITIEELEIGVANTPSLRPGGVSVLPVIPFFPLAAWGLAALLDSVLNPVREGLGVMIIGGLHTLLLVAFLISLVTSYIRRDQ
ncbi:MAG: hypothetical protein WC423_08855 [Vulcanimicrobiota bacterium]